MGGNPHFGAASVQTVGVTPLAYLILSLFDQHCRHEWTGEAGTRHCVHCARTIDVVAEPVPPAPGPTWAESLRLEEHGIFGFCQIHGQRSSRGPVATPRFR